MWSRGLTVKDYRTEPRGWIRKKSLIDNRLTSISIVDKDS